jgi:hypothetical protein
LAVQSHHRVEADARRRVMRANEPARIPPH